MTAYKKYRIREVFGSCPACDGLGKIQHGMAAGLPVFVDCGVCLLAHADRSQQARERLFHKDAELRAHAQERFGRSGR